jgi:hypothetical protein
MDLQSAAHSAFPPSFQVLELSTALHDTGILVSQTSPSALFRMSSPHFEVPVFELGLELTSASEHPNMARAARTNKQCFFMKKSSGIGVKRKNQRRGKMCFIT